MDIESGELNEELYGWMFAKICLFRLFRNLGGAATENTEYAEFMYEEGIAEKICEEYFAKRLKDKSLSKVVFTRQQIEAIEGVKKNDKVVLFGGYGTGKTMVLVERMKHDLTLTRASSKYCVIFAIFSKGIAENETLLLVEKIHNIFHSMKDNVVQEALRNGRLLFHQFSNKTF